MNLEQWMQIRHMATELQETELIASMEGGDLVAIDANCHLQYLTEIRNCHQSLVRQREQESESLSQEKNVKARIFVFL